MKKILRLVTTSVLTLTLVACGEASSSVASSTPASSSVSSPVTSTFAAVTRIDLSAATDLLTQTLGAQKTVVVTATLSANANPDQAIEWFVDGAKSNQTGRVFEFVPTSAKKFVISARVGSVNSTTPIEVNVTAPALAITGDVKVVDSKTLEVVAPGGAKVSVTNNTLEDSSFYNIKDGKYVINLKTALSSPDTYTVTLEKDGQTVTKSFLYDLRKLDATVTPGGAAALKAETDKSFKITRPNLIDTVTKGVNEQIVTYSMAFAASNLVSSATTPVAFSFKTLSVPTGGDRITDATGQILVPTAAASAAGTFTFNVNRDTPVGKYEYEYTVNGFTSTVVINVVAPVQTVSLTQVTGGSSVFTLDNKATVAANKFDVKLTQTGIGNFESTNARVYGLTPNAAGQFEVTKDFLQSTPTDAAQYKAIEFVVEGKNFGVPTNLEAQTGVEPNQVLVNLVGPNSSTFMRVTSPTPTQLTLPAPDPFRDAFTGFTVTQYIDTTTVPGLYTFNVRVLRLGVEIETKKIEILVKETAVDSEIFAFRFDAGEAYPIVKASFVNSLQKTGGILPAATVLTEANVRTALNGTLPTDITTTGSGLVAEWFAGTAETSYDSAKVLFANSLVRTGGHLVIAEDTVAQIRAALEAAYPLEVKPYNYTNWLAAKTTYENGIKAKFFTAEGSAIDAQVVANNNDGKLTDGSAGEIALFAGTTAAQKIANYNLFKDWMLGQILEVFPFPSYIVPDANTYSNTALLSQVLNTITVGFNNVVVDSLADVQDGLDGILPDDAPDSIIDLFAGADGAAKEINYDSEKVKLFGHVLAKASGAVLNVAADTTAGVAAAILAAHPDLSTATTLAKWQLAKETYESNIKSKFLPDNTSDAALVLAEFAGLDADAQKVSYNAFKDWMLARYLEVYPFPAFIPATLKVAFEAEEDGSYIIDRNRLSSFDAQTIRFGITIENFQSPTNPAATNANAWTNAAGLKKEFLTLSKTATSPQSLDNLVFNQITSKIGVEMGVAEEVGAMQADLDPVTTTEFLRVGSVDNTVDIPDLFVLDITSITSLGDYTFNLQVGTINKQIKVKVVEPIKSIHFGLLQADYLGSAITNSFKLNATDGKYYATLGPALSGETTKVVAPINLVLKNFAPTSGELTYTLSRNLAGLTDTITDKAPVTDGFGNDGLHVSLGADSATLPKSLLNVIGRNVGSLNLGLYPALTAVAENNTTTVNNLDDYRTIELSKDGEYTFTLTIDGVTETLTLVVLPYPTVTVDSAKVGTTNLIKLDGIFALEETGVDIKVEFGVTGKSLPTGPIFYQVFVSGIASQSTDFFIFATEATITSNKTGISAGRKSITGVIPDNKLKELKGSFEFTFVDGVENDTSVDAFPALDTSSVAVAADATRARKVNRVVALYSAKANASDAANTDYTLIGFAEFSIWIIDFVENPKA